MAAAHDVTRTAVERRIKTVAIHLAGIASVDGLNINGAAFVRRLRLHREALHTALESLEPPAAATARSIRILNEDEIAAGAQRIRRRSQQPLEDLALYYMLFAIGARPLEIARLEVQDYLDVTGSVRRLSLMRAEVAITCRARPLYFRSGRLDDALDAYLAERVRRRAGLGVEGQFRGLDPSSRLFLSSSGRGFEIVPYGEAGQRRFRCRGIQETYRKLLRYAELDSVTALTARHTVADRLYTRGADELQVGLLLGIAERSAVREQFPRRQPTLDELTRDLV
ncbi:site-specific integrase [Xenophilus azovorans]|uniref:site-specific integrase n=1 Tax=Xenophilus azovorans TaxID=151755 RepID=UPI001FDF7399|nr:site-specific integrase [Xenophilus azovorans]